MKVVVGLGNPGSQYAGTRHNIGWLVMDRIAERANWAGKGRQRDASNVAMGRFRGLDLTLVKPLTYMNESGLAVRKVIAREHAPLADLLIVADDFALPFGKLRFREGGGPGGHNGLRSIIDELGTEKFSRLRVGIGEPDRGAVDHVLTRFAPDEQQRLDELLDAAADAVEAWAREGTNKAANRFNMFELRPADTTRLAAAGEVDGPPDADGDPAHADRLAADPPGRPGRLSRARDADARPARPRPPDRRTRGDRVRRPPRSAQAGGRGRLRRRRCRCRGRRRATSAAAAPRPAAEAGRGAGGSPERRRPTHPGPVGPAAAARGDRHADGAPRTARRPATTNGEPAGTSVSSRCRTAPRPTSRRRSRWSPAGSGSSGSRATRRSATGSRRSSRPGRATRRPSPCSSRAPRWPTSAAS